MSTAFRAVLDSLQRPVSVYSAGDDGLRHATWLELFFDLVFIVAVAQLGAVLREGLTLVGILEYASLFVLVWWPWLGFSYYADVFDTNDLFSQLAIIVVMFGVIILSQTIPNALHGESFAFAAAFLFLRLLYLGLTFRAWYLLRAKAKKFLNYWLTFSSLSTAVWALSLVNPEPGRFGLWISAFLLEIAGIGIVYLVFDSIPIQVSHFPERLGLFTILVLGETILAIAVGTEGIGWYYGSGPTALGGFLIAVALWWLYFSHFDERAIDRVLEGTEAGWVQLRERMLIYVFGHYFVFTGIGAAGVGIEAVIEATVHGHAIESAARIALSCGIGAYLLGTSICHRAMPTALHPHLFLARIVAGILLVVAVVGGRTGPLSTIWIVGLSLVGLGVFEGYYQRTDASLPSPEREGEPET